MSRYCGAYCKQRKKIIERNKKNLRCHWCRKPLTVKQTTIDHIIPVTLLKRIYKEQPNYPRLGQKNMVISCAKCNGSITRNLVHDTIEGLRGMLKNPNGAKDYIKTEAEHIAKIGEAFFPLYKLGVLYETNV